MINGINTYSTAPASTAVGRDNAFSDQSLGTATETEGPQKQAAKAPIQEAASGTFFEQAEEVINTVISQQLPNTRLQIDRDEASGRVVYKGIDKESGEVVNQYPSEQILEFIAFYREPEGLVVDSEV